MEAYRTLRRLEQVFVDLWIEQGTATGAVRILKPQSKRPKSLAYKLKHRPGVQQAYRERLEEAIEEAGVTHLATLRQLARIAHFDHRKLFDERGDPLPVHRLPDDVATALAGIEVEEVFGGRGEDRQQTGRVHKYRVNSQVEALKILAQYQRLLIERHEHTGKDGGPIETRSTQDLTDEQLESIVRRGLARRGGAGSGGASGPTESP